MVFFVFLRLSVLFSMILFLQDLKAADIDVSDQKTVTNKWLEQCHFQQYFSYISWQSVLDGGNWSTRRKPPTSRKSLTSKSLQ
jgi:hypothetical protein